MREIAIAIGVTQTAIRNHFADLDHLFALTLTRHLDHILAAIAAVPGHHPDLFARRRAEYLRATRGICNAPTPEHVLWTRERFTLPEDELEPLELRRRMIGAMLAGQAGETALTLLDSPHLNTPEIEALLHAQARFAEEQSRQAEAPPETPPGPPKPKRLAPPPATRPAPPPGRPANTSYLRPAQAPPPAEPARLPWQTAPPQARAAGMT